MLRLVGAHRQCGMQNRVGVRTLQPPAEDHSPTAGSMRGFITPPWAVIDLPDQWPHATDLCTCGENEPKLWIVYLQGTT